MVSEEIYMIERIGVAFVAFYLTFKLLTRMQEKSFLQSDAILKMANETLIENTSAIHRMCEGLEVHIKQKDTFIDQMIECRHQREEGMKELRENQLHMMRAKGR